MLYPLGNDEQGTPIDVPPQAAGWLVRRHAGGKGRPGAVYDGSGSPLVLPLNATANDLRGEGLGPGIYRLDAVDDQRQRLASIPSAYTEIAGEPDLELLGDVKVGSATEASLLALTKLVMQTHRETVEAMRVRDRENAERERVFLARLMELTGPRVNGLTVNELDELEKHREKAVTTELARRNAASVGEDGPKVPEELWWVPMVQPLITSVTAAITTIVAQKVATVSERRPAVASEVPPQVAPPPRPLPRAEPAYPRPAVGDRVYGHHRNSRRDGAPGATELEPRTIAPAGAVATPADRTRPDERSVDVAGEQEVLGGEIFVPHLAVLGVPTEAQPVIADRLDVILGELDEDEVTAIGSGLAQLGQTHANRLRELLMPLACMTRVEAVAFAKASLVPALRELTGSVGPCKEQQHE